MGHDFKNFPELTNSQMEIYYFESPHKQIVEDFRATVVKISDGDTIRVEWDERDFDFPIRLARINAPELKEEKGLESAIWLKERILGKEVDILIDSRNRVEKFGRLIGDVVIGGESMSEASLRDRQSIRFGESKDGVIPPLEAFLQ